jgi:hypothetical protein
MCQNVHAQSVTVTQSAGLIPQDVSFLNSTPFNAAADASMLAVRTDTPTFDSFVHSSSVSAVPTSSLPVSNGAASSQAIVFTVSSVGCSDTAPAPATAASSLPSNSIPAHAPRDSTAAATSSLAQPPFDVAHPFFPLYKRYVSILAVLREVCESRPWQHSRLRFSCDPSLILLLWHVCAAANDSQSIRAEIEGWLSPLITSVATLPQHQRQMSYQITLHASEDWNSSPHLNAELLRPFEAMQTLWCDDFRHTGMTLLSEVSAR